MASTLIVDIADGQICLVRLEGRGRKAVVNGCAAMPAPEAEPEAPLSPDAVAEAAVDLAARHSLLADDCVLGLDCRSALLREFVFPFSSRSKIERALLFQLLEESPVPLDELVYSLVRGPVRETGTHISVAALRRTELGEWLAAFDRAGLPISRACLDLDGMVNCCNADNTGRVIVVDIGEERTVAAFMESGRLLAGRVADQGERDVLDTLVRECGLGHDAAERTLIFADLTAAAEGTEPASAEERTLYCVRQGLESLCTALHREIALFQRHHGYWPEEMIVGGPLARVRGLKSLLEDRFDCRVRLWAEDCVAATTYDSVAESCSYMRAHGLAHGIIPGFDFCQGEFARSSAHSMGGPMVRRTMFWAGGVLVSFMILALATAHSRMQQADLLQEKVARVYRKALDGVRSGLSSMQYESILRQRMADFDASRNNNADRSVLDVLAAVHGVADVASSLRLGELTLDGRRVAFKGEAAGFDAVEKVRAALEKNALFSAAEIKESAVRKKGKGIRFAMELERKP